MMDTQYALNRTSNDLLFSLHGEYAPRSLNYEIVAQGADEVQDIQNAPAVSMARYLADSGQTRLLSEISIYELVEIRRDLANSLGIWVSAKLKSV